MKTSESFARRKSKGTGWILLILCCSATAAFSQDSIRNDTLHYDAPVKDTVEEGVRTALVPLAIGAGYTAFGLLTYRFLDKRIKEFAQANQSRIATDIFKTAGYPGLGKSNYAIGIATGISAVFTRDQRLEKATILLAGAHVINDFLTNQLKITFQRHRPNTGDPYNSFDWRGGPRENKSFVSAHTSNAFTTATVFAICFKDKKWVPVVAYSLASMVGLSRIYENEHWASDVLGGAAIGFLSAQGMNKLYNILGRKLTFLPDIGPHYYGSSLSYIF